MGCGTEALERTEGQTAQSPGPGVSSPVQARVVTHTGNLEESYLSVCRVQDRRDEDCGTHFTDLWGLL